MSDTFSLFPPFGDPWSSCLLPSQSLLGRVTMVARCFHFITLSICCHSLLAFRVSVERSAVSLMGILLYVIRCFSLATVNIFFFVFNFH